MPWLLATVIALALPFAAESKTQVSKHPIAAKKKAAGKAARLRAVRVVPARPSFGFQLIQEEKVRPQFSPLRKSAWGLDDEERDHVWCYRSVKA